MPFNTRGLLSLKAVLLPHRSKVSELQKQFKFAKSLFAQTGRLQKFWQNVLRGKIISVVPKLGGKKTQNQIRLTLLISGLSFKQVLFGIVESIF